jgi:hypothetical protein
MCCVAGDAWHLENPRLVIIENEIGESHVHTYVSEFIGCPGTLLRRMAAACSLLRTEKKPFAKRARSPPPSP